MFSTASLYKTSKFTSNLAKSEKKLPTKKISKGQRLLLVSFDRLSPSEGALIVRDYQGPGVSFPHSVVKDPSEVFRSSLVRSYARIHRRRFSPSFEIRSSCGNEDRKFSVDVLFRLNLVQHVPYACRQLTHDERLHKKRPDTQLPGFLLRELLTESRAKYNRDVISYLQ